MIAVPEQKNYSEEDLAELIDKTTKVGAVLATFYFDAQGNDEKELQNSLVDFVSRITNEKGVLYCTGQIEPVVKTSNEKTPFSTFAEVSILAKNFNVLVNLALVYGPIAVEIVKPKEVRLDAQEAQAILLDASQNSQDFVKYIMEKTLQPTDRQAFSEKLRKRAELGARLREKISLQDKQ
ncbi:MAG: hypothetical protein ACP5IG_01490 [Candidatus Micrarchaeia archaeon]